MVSIFDTYVLPDGCSEEQMYSAVRVVWKGIELSPMSEDDVHPKLIDVREDIINVFEAEIVTYFPQNKLKHFAIFDPNNFPSSKLDADTYGQEDIMKVAKFMDFTTNQQVEIASEWKDFVEQMNDPEFLQVRDAEANYFWFFYLNDNVVKFKDQIKIALSLAVTSSDAERALSVMAGLKVKNRNNMGHELLNALMWFEMNVASSVEEFPAFEYSKKWKAVGFMLVDDPGHPSKRQCLDEFLTDDEYNVRRNAKLLSGRSSLF